MTSNQPIRAHRVRQLMELVGSSREVSPEQRRGHVADGVLRLLGGTAALQALVVDFVPGARPRALQLAARGYTGAARRRQLHALEAGTSVDPLVALGARVAQRAYLRRDLLPDREWYGSRWYREELRAAELDDGVYASRRVEGSTTTECVGIFRCPGDRSFTVEDREIVHLLVLELPRLFRPPLAPKLALAMRGLSPREAETLGRLCRGQSEKQIADALGISRHTVHDYVKALHRAFGVASRSELLARFIGEVGEPEDTPRRERH